MKSQPKLRKCKNKACGELFFPSRPMQTVCSVGCSIIIAKDKARKDLEAKAKVERVIDKARLIEMKPVKWFRAKAKTAQHAYIRARDEGMSCISCDTILVRSGRIGGDYDAGHFRSVGSAKHMEFVENNIHGQCKKCNNFLAGNQINYEIGLIARYGISYVETLKNDNAQRHLGIDDFKRIEAEYKLKLKELQAMKEVA